MDELFQNVRESCSPAVWSKGVELARGDNVTGDKDTGSEVHLRVLARTGVSPRVILYIDDGEWQCSCGGDDDPCAHVAAAVIAIRRAREQGKALPQSAAAQGRLTYRFLRETSPGSNNILFIRRLVAAGVEEPLPASLSALTSGRVKGPSFAATAEDHAIDQALAGERGEVLPAKIFPALLAALSKIEGLTLDGAPLMIDTTPVSFIVVVRDDGPGVRVEASADPAIQESFQNGVALCTSGLRPVVRPVLTPLEQDMLRPGSGRFFGRQELGFLAAEILPSLESRLTVDVRTTKLPRRTGGLPRLELELSGTGARLTVTPAIVYGEPVTARVKGGLLYTYGNTVPVRDLDHERRLRDDLSRTHGLALDDQITLPPSAAVALVERLGRFTGDISGDGFDAFRQYEAVVPHFSVGDFSFELGFSSTGGKSADPAAVLHAWRTGERLVALLDGGYAPLPQDWLARYGTRIQELLAARGDRETIPRAAAPLLAETASAMGLALPPALAALREALTQFERIPPYAPKNLHAALRSYQKFGVDWLAFLRTQGLGALLADDMGLGKTLQTIAIIDGRTLVVAPTSVAPNWLAELSRFRPDLRVALYHGGDRALDPTADVTITTYAILRLDLAHLAPITWDMAVLDEAQLIKNPQSQVARAAAQLNARFRVALSGTPVENRLDDLYSQMRFLNPGLLGDQKSFQDLYVRRIEAGDQDAAQRLRQRVKPFVLRRLKSEVAPELPPRTDVTLHVELSPSERERYDAIRAATRKEVLEKLAGPGDVFAALEALLRLRQAASHPDLLPGVEGEASSKVFTFMDRLAESLAGGHKALVFSQWTRFLDLLAAPLAAAGIAFLRLDGTTVDRQAVVRAFQDPAGPPVLIMSLKAGGVGLNLTAADHVFIMDPWWNPAAEDQAADRAHRIGQENPVLVHRLVAKDTVEERILLLQDKKRALAGAALGAAGGAAQGITREDLLALFD